MKVNEVVALEVQAHGANVSFLGKLCGAQCHTRGLRVGRKSRTSQRADEMV